VRGGPAGRLALPRPRLRAAALALAVLGAELVVAGAVVEPRFTKLLAPVVAVAALALTYALPMAVSTLFVALTASILYGTFFAVNVGRPVYLPELVLGALLIVAITRPRRETWGGAAGGALAVFFVSLALANLAAVTAGRISFNTGVDYSRDLFFLAFFWVVVRLFPEPERLRRLLVLCVGIAAVTGVAALALSLRGDVHSFVQGPGDQAITADQGVGSLVRVRLPGAALAYGLFWFTVAQALTASRRRPAWALALVPMAVCMGVSYNRNMWLGLVFGLAIVLVSGGRRTRGRIGIAVTVAIMGILLLVISGPQLVGPTSALSPLVERGQTLLTPKREVSTDPSLADRGKETKTAWRNVRSKLLFGLGPGAPIGQNITAELGPRRYKQVPQRFVHNQYLYLVVLGGLPLFAAFLTYLAVTLRDAWRGRIHDPSLGTLFTGVAMVMLSATVMLYFTEPGFVVLLALMGAAVHVLTTPVDPAPDPG